MALDLVADGLVLSAAGLPEEFIARRLGVGLVFEVDTLALALLLLLAATIKNFCEIFVFSIVLQACTSSVDGAVVVIVVGESRPASLSSTMPPVSDNFEAAASSKVRARLAKPIGGLLL